MRRDIKVWLVIVGVCVVVTGTMAIARAMQRPATGSVLLWIEIASMGALVASVVPSLVILVTALLKRQWREAVAAIVAVAVAVAVFVFVPLELSR